MLQAGNGLLKLANNSQQTNHTELHHTQNAVLFEKVFETLQCGVFILSKTGEIVHSNTSAEQILDKLNVDNCKGKILLLRIWKLCELLLKNKQFSTTKNAVISDEVVVDKSNIFLIRVKTLDYSRFNCLYLLVTVENRFDSLENVALSEAKKYKLTQREAEIWCLHRAQYSYKEIAAHLVISINTVKKHIKNIHIKQQTFF
jgi:DNA-binding CsgD family transcriptional regulator